MKKGYSEHWKDTLRSLSGCEVEEAVPVVAQDRKCLLHLSKLPLGQVGCVGVLVGVPEGRLLEVSLSVKDDGDSSDRDWSTKHYDGGSGHCSGMFEAGPLGQHAARYS